jgi:hypothetical protein
MAFRPPAFCASQRVDIPEHALHWVIDRLAETVGEQRIDGMDRNRDRLIRIGTEAPPQRHR